MWRVVKWCVGSEGAGARRRADRQQSITGHIGSDAGSNHYFKAANGDCVLDPRSWDNLSLESLLEVVWWDMEWRQVLRVRRVRRRGGGPPPAPHETLL